MSQSSGQGRIEKSNANELPARLTELTRLFFSASCLPVQPPLAADCC